MFKARQTMDALTTSSADHRGTGSDSGRSGDANATSRTGGQETDSQESGQEGYQDERGWFAPAKSRSTMEPHQHAADGEQPAVSSRKMSPVRPVGKHSKPHSGVTVP